MAFPVALQLYSVRNEFKEDPRGTLTAVKEMGYDGVEFARFQGHDPQEIKAICQELGLTMISAHVPLQDMLKTPEETFAIYQDLEIPYVAVPYLPPEIQPKARDYRETIHEVAEVCKSAKQAGLKMLYHNHDFEFLKIDGEYALDMLYREIPAELLNTELDVCWVAIGGENPADYIRKYAGRCPIVHLKDYFKSGETTGALYELIGIEPAEKKEEKAFEFRPVGKGMQDIPRILKACKQAGAEWLVVEQDEPSMGLAPLECAKASIDYLKIVNV